MKKILQIYVTDIKAILKNYAAIVVIVALCILPSLYAWFNIKASWDPYSKKATSGIQIGVVNEDEGTTVKDNVINIGDKVVEGLKENEQLGWQFVDKETATDAVNKGKYYAVITIPQNFSEDLTSILTTDVKQGEIIYTVNEKINAIAPKLTDKGVTGLQEMISKTVVETVSHAIFEVGNEVGINIEQQMPKISNIYHELLTIQGKFKEINQTVENTSQGVDKLKQLITNLNQELPNIQHTIESAKGFGENIKTFVDTSKNTTDQLAPSIKQDIKIISDIAQEIATQTEALKSAIIGGSEKAPVMIAGVVNKVSSLKTMVGSLSNLLETFNKLAPNQPFTSYITQLNTTNTQLGQALDVLVKVQDQVNQGIEPDLTTLDKIIQVTTKISQSTNEVYINFDSKIMGQIQTILGEAYVVAEKAIVVLQAAEEKLPKVKELLTIASTSVDKGKEGIEYVKKILPGAETTINEVVDKISQIEDNQDLKELVTLLKADVAKRSEFLSNPVTITEEKLFPMQNYGTGMTPFYSVLSFWVGILLLVSILTVNTQGEYKSYQVYFGKLALFLSLAAIQALIVSTGDIFLLKIYCKNPGLFILSNIFIGMTFAVIVYSLVSVLGNVGKVVAIILLVLQVAGSGGTFPIQLTPVFFQRINPFLPFTYGISMNREMIGGIVQEVLYQDLIILIIYSVIFIVLAVLFKRPINKVSRKFVEKFASSRLGE